MQKKFVRSTRFSGMKVNPYENSSLNMVKNQGPKKRKKKVSPSSIANRKGLSAYQLKTQEEFMKVKPGETREQWLYRTRYRRIRTEEEISLSVRGKIKINKLILRRQQAKNKKVIQLWVLEKDFNFMKYYVFIINWASIKYNIPQMDLETGFHFYENIYFTPEEFNNKCRLFSTPITNNFFRFKRQGYIVPNMSNVNNNNVKRETGFFKLSKGFINVLTEIYEKLAYQEPFDFKPNLYRTIPEELEATIIEMAMENEEILTGKKEPSKIVINVNNKDGRYKEKNDVL